MVERTSWLLMVKFDSCNNLLSSVHTDCIILRSVKFDYYCYHHHHHHHHHHHEHHYYYYYMPFGLRNAPATFSRLATKVFKRLEEFWEAYLDDVMVFSRSWEAHIIHLHQVFERVRLANLKLNIRKCEFANANLDFLEHTLSLNMV